MTAADHPPVSDAATRHDHDDSLRGGPMSDQLIQRIDKYTITVNGYPVRATDDQEARLRLMTDEQRERFVKVMGGAR